MAIEQFEFVVIGGGKGGKTLVARLASSGHQVAMIEAGMIGGLCINVACIPTKVLVQSAKVAEVVQDAAAYYHAARHDLFTPNHGRRAE